MIFWNYINYFSPDEMGAVDMHPGLMFNLDYFRRQIDCPVIIHCGYETSGHSPNSYHYKKMAVDFHVEGHKDYKKQLRLLIDAGFSGIGWYPEWNNPGWHVDVRPGELTIWKQENGKYIYLI